MPTAIEAHRERRILVLNAQGPQNHIEIGNAIKEALSSHPDSIPSETEVNKNTISELGQTNSANEHEDLMALLQEWTPEVFGVQSEDILPSQLNVVRLNDPDVVGLATGLNPYLYDRIIGVKSVVFPRPKLRLRDRFYEKCFQDDPRHNAALIVWIKLVDRLLCLVNVHKSEEGKFTRIEQAEQVADAIKEFGQIPDEGIIAGDFNIPGFPRIGHGSKNSQSEREKIYSIYKSALGTGLKDVSRGLLTHHLFASLDRNMKLGPKILMNTIGSIGNLIAGEKFTEITSQSRDCVLISGMEFDHTEAIDINGTDHRLLIPKKRKLKRHQRNQALQAL